MPSRRPSPHSARPTRRAGLAGAGGRFPQQVESESQPHRERDGPKSGLPVRNNNSGRRELDGSANSSLLGLLHTLVLVHSLDPTSNSSELVVVLNSRLSPAAAPFRIQRMQYCIVTLPRIIEGDKYHYPHQHDADHHAIQQVSDNDWNCKQDSDCSIFCMHRYECLDMRVGMSIWGRS